MFRTGHRTDPSGADKPEPPRAEPSPVEAAPVEQAAARVTPDAPAVMTAAKRHAANLGRGVTFDGTLRFSGTLTIEGAFTGHILAGDTLVIGDGATVHADVTCGAIEVFGEVQGRLTGTRAVELRAAARVSADVTTPSLRVADGAILDGTVKMRGASTATRTRSDRAKRPGRVADASTDAQAASDEAVPVG